jgi:hypothetical protein
MGGLAAWVWCAMPNLKLTVRAVGSASPACRPDDFPPFGPLPSSGRARRRSAAGEQRPRAALTVAR